MTATQLATNPDCADVQVFTFHGEKDEGTDRNLVSAMSGPHLTLGMDYMPGSKKQHWWLTEENKTSLLEGEGTPDQISQQVCPIASRRGATVN